MYAEMIEREVLSEVESKCELPYRQPNGKAAVLQDKLLGLLKEAAKVYRKPNKKNHGLPKEAYITLLTDEDCFLTAEVWNKSGQYVRLNERIGCKVERPFRMAVNLEILHKLIKQAAPERVDLIANFEKHVLTVRVGAMVNDFPALPTIELEPPDSAETIQVITKEQEQELKWLKRAVATEDNRPRLQYVYAAKQDDIPVLVASNGYALHISTNHAEGLNGYIDVRGVGPAPDQEYVDFRGYTEGIEWQSTVAVLRDQFEQAVKTALVFARDAANSVKFSFSKGILTVSGRSPERGDVATILNYTPASFEMCISLNGQFVLNALSDCKGFSQPQNPAEPNYIKLQFGENNKEPMCMILHKGRAAIIMPLAETR